MQVIEQILSSVDNVVWVICMCLWLVSMVYLMYWAVCKIIETVEKPHLITPKPWRIKPYTDHLD